MSEHEHKPAPQTHLSVPETAVEEAAKLLCKWIGYAWDGAGETDRQGEFPDWVHNSYGGLSLQGGKPALRRIAAQMLACVPSPQKHLEGDQHPDDIAVDRFAAAMKAKLSKKRGEGRGGWEDKGNCTQSFLSDLLREHVEKGDPVDVGNLAMMLHQRSERISASDKYSLDAIAGMTEDQV